MNARITSRQLLRFTFGFALAAATLTHVGQARFAGFTPGNLALLVAGASASNTTGTVVEINTTTANQAAIQTIALPSTGADAYRLSGSATSTGYVSLSRDRTYLTFTGANSTDTTTNVNALNPRGVFSADAFGNVMKHTTYTGSNGNQTRSATTLDNSSWYIGDQGGFYSNGTASASPTGNVRNLRTFGGVVYAFTASASQPPVGVISAPTGGTLTGLPGLPTGNSSMQDFYLVQSGDNGATFDILYVLNTNTSTAGTISKYSLVSGTWTANGTYTTNFGGFGLAAADDGAGEVLYVTSGSGATTANKVIKLSDAAGYNTTINITTANNVTLYTTAAGTIIKGLDFTPIPAVPVLPSVNLSVSTTAASEAGATVVTVTATANNFSGVPQTVNVSVSGAGITAGDYTLSASTITIPNGSSSGSVTFTVIDDALVEGTETATVTISAPSSGLELGSTTSRNIAITDNDAADAAPFVTSTTPANGALNIGLSAPIVINFSESVTASASAFSLVCAGAPQSFAQSASPATAFTLTPSSPLPPSANCTVSIAANQIADADANDPPDGPTSNVSVSFSTAPAGAGKIMINEVDADTPGSDTAEFVELFDGGSGNTSLDGLVLVLFNGTDPDTLANNDKRAYAAFDLTGYSTNAQGYFVLGNPGVSGATINFDPGPFGLLQNGPDAAALYIGHAGDFPVGTNVTTTNLLDAIVYGTDDPSASGLLPLLNAGQAVVNENATGNSQTQSSQRCPAGMGGFRNSSPYYPGAPTPGIANNCPAPRPASDVVISQVYGGGGNGGATYRNDFIELYNRGTATADLTGWSLQYASSTGSGWDTNKQPLGGSIGAGEYYLIALASGGANGVNLPPANISGQINMAAGSGKIALVGSFTGLAGNCPIFDPTIKDLVGYGSADCGEGSTTTAAGSNTTSLFRKSGGAIDTDNNANDFNAPGAPNPRRTAAIVELGPNVLVTDPRANGFNAPRDATIQVTFTEPVDVDPGWFTLTCVSSGLHINATFAAAFGGQDHYITPNDNFIPGESCTVTILRNKIHDVDLDDSGTNTDSLPADYTWSFTVATGTAPPYPESVHLTMGNPSTAGSDPLNYLMEKPEFAMSYNRDLGRPNWVSWHLSDDWIGTLTRVDTFRPDPQVPPDWYRVQSFDFSGSGFDRGHMTPNADRDKETSTPINQATFLMSNMVAQAPGNNQGPWAAFEGYLRTLIEQEQDELYIVSGPNGAGGTGSLGGVTMTLANGHVTVPSSTWKVALVLPKDVGNDLSRVSCSTRTIAVIMPNLDNIRSDPWQNYITTVDAVEALTGYDLFSNLPEPYQRCIEAGTNGVNPSLVKGDQTISFAQLADATYGDAVAVSATGGASGNAVTFTASGACSATGFYGSTINILAPGTCSVTASQAGNDIYNAAPDVVRTFTILPAMPAFSALTSPTIEAGSASVDVSGALTFGGLPGPTGAVAITLNGITTLAPLAPNGQFSATFATAALPIAGSPYVIAFVYGGDVHFGAAVGASSLTIVDTTAPIVTYTGNLGAYGVTSTVNIHCAASDSGSGVVSTTCADITGPAYSFPMGVSTFSATATDAAGNVGSGSTSFTVGVTFADLRALVIQFSSNAGVANGLNAKLDAAEHAANSNARAGQLGAFQNQVNAQSGKALTATEAAILLRLVQALY